MPLSRIVLFTAVWFLLLQSAAATVTLALGVSTTDAKNIAAITAGAISVPVFVRMSALFPAKAYRNATIVDVAAVLLSRSDFDKVQDMLPTTTGGRRAVSCELLEQLQGCILFQYDYWGTFRFIGNNGTVKELADGSDS